MSDKHSQILIGAHTSTAGGLHNALLEGQQIGATTIQCFSSNQKQWKGRLLTPDEIDKWQHALQETGLKQIMVHDSYLINLGCPTIENLNKSRQAFQEEVARCVKLGVTYLNFHPGAALTSNVEVCLNLIVESLLQIKPIMENGTLRLLIEATAGQGSSVGHRFEHLGYLIERLKDQIPIGVCLDTCHIFAAGYDIRTPEAWNATLNEFDRLVGLQSLYAFHLNDSLKELGSRVDRHQPLGDGLIGWDSFRFLMNDPRTSHLPKYLETPGGSELWIEEIKKLKSMSISVK